MPTPFSHALHCLTLSLVSVSARAQEPAAPPASLQGQRVRVIPHNAPPFSGTFVALRSDTLVVATPDRERAIHFPAVARVDVSTGVKRNTGKGAMIGLGVGLIGGGVILYGACNASVAPRTCFESEEGAQYMYLLTVAALGATGALIGALSGIGGETDRWEAVPRNEISLALRAPRPGTLAAGLSLRF